MLITTAYRGIYKKDQKTTPLVLNPIYIVSITALSDNNSIIKVRKCEDQTTNYIVDEPVKELYRRIKNGY